MPSVSVYIPDKLYAKLLATKERPSLLVGRLIKEYLAKLETPEVFETLTKKILGQRHSHST